MVTVCGKTEKCRNEKNIKLSKLCITAKRILERRGIQTSSLNHLIVKIWLVCIHEFKDSFLSFWHLYGLVFYLEYIGSSLNLMASIWEKAISIFEGNLNSGRSYLINAILITTSWDDSKES